MKRIILLPLLVSALANNQVNAMNLQNPTLKKVVIFAPAIIGTIYGLKKVYDTYSKESKIDNGQIGPRTEEEILNLKLDIDRKYKNASTTVLGSWVMTAILAYYIKN